MGLLSLSRAPSMFEVERKFCGLAVKRLTVNGGSPPFRSLKFLGQKNFKDIYYDRSNVLSSNGVWVRERDGHWQAKIKRGGNFNNSRFEELTNVRDIARCVANLTRVSQSDEQEHFGLDPIAILATLRQSWIADEEFKIVLDTTDFGHTVGEVELQCAADSTGREEGGDVKKMKEMDMRIIEFMANYSWAFSPGVPKGKLTAFFELSNKKGL